MTVITGYLILTVAGRRGEDSSVRVVTRSPALRANEHCWPYRIEIPEGASRMYSQTPINLRMPALPPPSVAFGAGEGVTMVDAGNEVDDE